MDHLHAKEIHAAERYLLGELPAADAEEFELHYFECQQCALAVETGELFVANARAHFRLAPAPGTGEPPREVGQRRPSFLETLKSLWRPAFVAPVLAALAAVAIYQNSVTIPSLRRVLDTARALPAVQLIGVSRGEETVIHVPADAPFIALSADIPPGTPFQRYVCVLTSGREEISSSIVPAPADGQPITVLAPSLQFRNGSYALTLFGLAPDGQRTDKISTYPFSVQFN